MGAPTAGLGFKPVHFDEALASPAAGLWFEVHAENYMVEGGPRLAMLEILRERHPISLHGVGLSIAGAEDPDTEHLMRLKALVARVEPFLVSEHLAWSRLGRTCFPDLLPFPRTNESLARVARNIDIVQGALGRQVLIENPSLYVDLEESTWDEADFLNELSGRAGCGLLLDVNNVAVSANNVGLDPIAYVNALRADAIGELHLAGHSKDPRFGADLLIDSHDAPVSEGVWALYEHAVARIGPRPTLIERDGNIPAFPELLAERDRATALLGAGCEPARV